MNKRNLVLLILISILHVSFVHAAGSVPKFIPFQGRATDTSSNPINYAATFKFRIYPTDALL